MDELEAKRQRDRVLKSINWEALQHGHSQSYDKELGVYVGAEKFVSDKNEAIRKTLENKKKL